MATGLEHPRDAGTWTFLDAYRDILFGRTRDPSADIEAVVSRGERRTFSRSVEFVRRRLHTA